MNDKERGLYSKYHVTKLVKRKYDWEELPVGWVFVLNPATDPGAVFALRAYAVWAKAHGYEQLAADLKDKIKEYE